MERGEQLNLRPVRGRGRGGKGGRGRGGKQTKNDKDKHDDKEDQQTWTDDMEKAWNDFKAERQDALDKAWFEEYGEQDGEWIGDLGKEQKAWDRYAHHESKVSMHSLKQGEEIEKVEGEKKEKKDRKEKKEKKEKDAEKSEQKKKHENPPTDVPAKKRKVEAEGEEKAKEFVDEITDYIKDILTKKIKDTPEALKQKHKDQLRFQTPNSAECRLGVYWKRPGVGVAMRNGRQDICYFSVSPIRDGDYLIRLSASLKAASIFVT